MKSLLGKAMEQMSVGMVVTVITQVDLTCQLNKDTTEVTTDQL